MPKKIAFIGAGSFGFTRILINDLLTFPAFADCTLALMDIDDERLSFARQAAEKIVAAGKLPVKIIATKNRLEALEGADGIVCTILNGGVDIWCSDIEIPKKYGVDICVGDTRGPSGIFRFLRTAPVMLDICKDIAKVAPNAVFLNYTNPMAMLCRIMQGEFPKLTISGLCHSVQGTAEMLARFIGADIKDVTYTCAGINHMSFYLDYKWQGKDAYPLIKKAMKNKAIYNEEQVRNEIFIALGLYITESSGHNSEYNAWFRKRPDLIEKYCTHGTGWTPGEYAYILNFYRSVADSWRQETMDWLNDDSYKFGIRGHEYAAAIFNAIFGDGEKFTFNGNVRNFGLVDNLPNGACVEVPCLASKNGINPMHVGPLPSQVLPMVSLSSQIEELAVEASLTGDPAKVYQAICFDPLTSSVLSLGEIRSMVNDMFIASKDYLPQFKHKKV